MKKLIRLTLLSVVGLMLASAAHAQSTLIHYWDFNTLAQAYNNPSIPPLPADYSVLPAGKANVVYVLEPGTSSGYIGYIDNVASMADSNLRRGDSSGQALRVRNPSDSMELRIYIPSTGYSNLALTYELESSSTTSGQLTELFDYSVDSGATWRTTGLNMTTLDVTQAQYQGTSWGLVKLNFGTDLSVNNNPKLVFRIKFQGNTSLTKGNNRFDNITLDGVPGVSGGSVINVLAPSSGTTLDVGQTEKIIFTTAGTITPARTIDFSSDGGTTWSNVGTVTSDTSYNWTVPNSPTSTGEIRVTDGNHVVGTSGNFKILGPGAVANVTVGSPVGTAYVNTPTPIAWSATGDIGTTVSIDVSYDNKTTWSPIVANYTLGSASSYYWNAPTAVHTGAIVRVTFAKGAVGYSQQFSILPNVGVMRLIHYWNFNTLTATYNNPNTPAIQADYSAINASQATINYVLEPGASSHYAGYIDGVAGDTINARLGAPAGSALRIRNPSDSMELRFNISTVGFKGIVLKYALQSSSLTSGQLSQHYDYSVDGGNTWTTKGLALDSLDVSQAQYQATTSYGLATVTFGSDTTVNNNPNLVFRIKFGANASMPSGNNRFDNVTVEGITLPLGVSYTKAVASDYNLYPNPATDRLYIGTNSTGLKTVSVMDVTGRLLLTSKSSDADVLINTSSLHAGVYFVRVQDEVAGTFATMKFVKE